MDIALRTPELVSIILSYARDDNSWRPSTLASCVTVNRLFSGEAMRLLWMKLKDLKPIIMILRNNMEMAECFLPGYLDASDWERAAPYCALVRSIGNVQEPIHAAIARAYSILFPDSPIFPNLIRIDGLNQRNLIQPYLSMKLKSLALVVDQDIGILRSYDALDELKELEEVELELRTSWRSTSKIMLPMKLLRPVLQKKLRTLHLLSFNLSTAHLQMIDSLSPIEYLNIRTYDFDIGVKRGEISKSTGFPHLAHLRVWAAPSSCKRLIQMLGLYPRHRLHIEAPGFSDPSDILSTIGSIHAFDLKELKIVCPSHSYPALSANIIGPIYRLTALEILIITPGVPIDLQDEDIGSLIRTLPCLAELHIGLVNGKSLSSTRLTPNCLTLVARHSITLVSLRIHVGSQWQSFVTDTEYFVSSCPLKSLDLTWSVLPPEVRPGFRYLQVAHKLDRLFPYHSSFDSEWKRATIQNKYDPEGSRVKKAWIRVDKTLVNLRKR